MAIILNNKDGVLLKTAGKYCPEDIIVKPNLQTKTATANGDVLPDDGYCGLEKVTVNVPVTPAQEKTITITKNGTQEVVPDSGNVLSKVTVTTNVPSGSELNIHYGDTAPEDTSKLWIKSTEPESIEFIQNPEQQVQGLSLLDEFLPTAAGDIAAAAVGTKIYLFGGVSSGYICSNTIQEFDTETKTIQTLSTTLPTAARGIAAAAVGTKIYLFGGDIGSGSSNTIQEFDTETKTIQTLSTTLQTKAYGIAAAAVGTKIYLFGGTGSGYYKTIQEFDTETKTLTILSTTLQTKAYGIAAAAVGTKIYLFGGTDNNSSLKTIQKFDTETKTLTTLSATLSTAAYGIAAAAVGTKIYLFGSVNISNRYSNTIQEFDTETKTIQTLSTTLPTTAARISAAAVGTKIYLFGGSSNNGYFNTIQEFIVTFILTSGNILGQQSYDKNIFTLVPPPTKVTIGLKNVYKGNSNNIAEFVDAYLYDGTNWVNVNTGETV